MVMPGTTHIPRPEDWPVYVSIFSLGCSAVPDWSHLCRMPVEHLNVTFKPNSFFRTNPSMDVPGTFDLHSRPAFPNGVADGSANGNGSVCHH